MYSSLLGPSSLSRLTMSLYSLLQESRGAFLFRGIIFFFAFLFYICTRISFYWVLEVYRDLRCRSTLFCKREFYSLLPKRNAPLLSFANGVCSTLSRKRARPLHSLLHKSFAVLFLANENSTLVCKRERPLNFP